MTIEELSIPPLEMEIGECLRFADKIECNIIRRLAFERDSLKRRLGQTQVELDTAENELKQWRGVDSDWKTKLRDFASDAGQHNIKRSEWKDDRDELESITLYAHGGFFTAYFDDAADLWEMANDDLPMHHVMVRSDPPHRTCIHPMHLAAWLTHMAETIVPVRVKGRLDA